MALPQQDRLFLRDCINFSWMQRIVAAHAFAHGGGQIPNALAGRALEAFYPEKPQPEVVRMVHEGNQNARVQGIMLARITAEFAATLEETGAFVRAIERRGHGGILRNNFDYVVSDVRDFFERVHAIDQPTLTKLLRFPNPLHLMKYRGTELFKDAKSQHQMTARRIAQAATNYLKVGKERIFKLNTGRLRPDWQHNIHVLVDISPSKPVAGAKKRKPKGVFIRTYDKLKHGFNVLEAAAEYVKLPRHPVSIDVVKLSNHWDNVAKILQTIETLGILKARLAGLTLRLDDAGLLDTDRSTWPAVIEIPAQSS